ncbi:lysylphosphatidylglycerol synthase domain-containing protein [Ramlibacter tataouinensis]|uniref:Candidate membrane protein n=1 Tax=Ramlibacter tataouinensis (strain ATCC BAA-407 / DSM 14655 / LMG 21543 / TTB310) TaxID=365046 RepID=F5Y2C7_RAMTT|nr:candidate membrane protein [Ramlibacter tataouinensis TTB310]
MPSPARPVPHPGAAAPAAAASPPARGWSARPWWPWLKRGLTIAFFAAVAYYTVRYARNVDWGEVWRNILATPRGVLLAALAGVAASYAIYCSFDLLGRHYTRHGLPKSQVWQVNFISYAFNLNMGSLVGSVAFRYRLYGRLGLDVPTITQVMTLSILTNWLGYLLLGGAVFAVAPLQLPPDWKVGSEGLRWLGVGMLAVGLAYLGACFFATRRSLHLRGHELILPPARMAVLQVVMAVTNWMVMGAILFTLLQGKVGYFPVLSVLLVAAVAGVITHVPAGLGVLEAVFIALLSHQVPEAQLLAALLSYRALYYIGPLLLAAVLYLFVEARARRNPAAPAPAR